jgi:hypothetical protein
MAALEAHIRTFQPPRMPFDAVSGYKSEIQAAAADLKFMAGIETTIQERLGEQRAALKGAEIACPPDDNDQAREAMLAAYDANQKAAAKLPELARACTEVTVPRLVGLTVEQALSHLYRLDLTDRIHEHDQPTVDPKKAGRVAEQFPAPGETVPRQGTVQINVWDPFDRENACAQVRNDFNIAIGDKNQQQARSLLTELESLGCDRLAEARADLNRAEKDNRRAKKTPRAGGGGTDAGHCDPKTPAGGFRGRPHLFGIS